jgi:hypothetical protein|tara:strand:- start:6570 stop:7067 length:498 start_codon:yes stop_codon:yes gene_type:complete
MEDDKWTPIKALGRARQSINELLINELVIDKSDKPELMFSQVYNANNEKLEEFLVMYSGYKAYLETEISKRESERNALEAAFEEGYSKAMYTLYQERENGGKKKPVKDEIRGEIFSKYPGLENRRKEIIEKEIALKELSGLLNTYTTAYNTISRIVALRTYGGEK